MALRKQKIIDIPSESQRTEEDSQEDVAADGQDEPSSSLLATSSARGKRQKEDKSKPKEMTEEEMMDLALRLSEQEASVTALRRQQEEEAVMKAIEESMVGQTQASRTSQSPSQRVNASLSLCSRRKLAYSNGKKNPDIDRGTSEDGCTPAGTRDDDTRNVRRKRKAGSPLPEMPDLSQTQKIYSQASPCSSESPLALPDSPQSSDSTQIEDSQLRRSPVFPLTGCRAEIRIDRLSRDLLDTCRSSGFVLCTQDSLNSPQKSTRPKSPTFPASNLASGPKSSVLSGADPSDSEPSPECVRSTASGRNIPHERSACKPGDSVCSQARENSGFTFSSQESLTPSVRPTSPVFPRSPSIPPSEWLAFPKGPDRAQSEPSHARAVSPVFGPQKKSGSPAERRGPSGASRDGRGRVDGLKASESEEPSRRSKSPDRAETEPSSNMMLVWTDEDEDDDDVTMSFPHGHSSSNARLAPPHRLQPTGSPSPVFPEETSILHAESPAASRNHVASSSGMSGPKCSLNPQKAVKDQSSSYKHASLETSPKSSGGEHPSPTEQELQPAGSDSWTGPQSGAAGSTTVHYYWGVPFCPRGLDPDTYTQVIVAQMEAYEKSLKRAQRRLLRKAEWGEAVLPQPEKSPPHESPAGSPQHHGPRRRGLRLRSKSQNEAADSPTAEEEEEEEGRKDEEKPRKMENKEEEEKDKGEEEQMDAEECQVCPETPPSDDTASQDLTLLPEAEARPGAKSPEFPELQMILHRDSPARNEPQEEEAEGATGEKMEGDVPVSSSDGGAEEVKEDSRDPDVEEIKGRRPQRAASPEEEPAIIPRSPETAVDCPICQASFPASKIEMHAAYCDGEVAVVEERRPAVDCIQVSLKPRRKRTRRANAEETNDHCDVSSRNQEKCYVCQKDVALKDYRRHTELCIAGSKTAARGNLLLALDRTESRDSDAGPSGSRLLPGDVIDLRDDDDDDDDDDEVSAFRVSNSPIRSFTSISEATDCLIDFKKQQRAKKPCQRRR